MLTREVPTMNKQEFGNRISVLRRLKNISQTEFAEMLDISVSALSKIERGVNSPRVITAEAMAENLDVSIGRLLSSNRATVERQEYIDEIIEQLSTMDDCDIESITRNCVLNKLIIRKYICTKKYDIKKIEG